MSSEDANRGDKVTFVFERSNDITGDIIRTPYHDTNNHWVINEWHEGARTKRVMYIKDFQYMVLHQSK